jgi:hypothetical protein
MLSKIIHFHSTITLELDAERQGKYLARMLNSVMKAGGHANSEAKVDVGPHLCISI